jgi:hypothetical protein
MFCITVMTIESHTHYTRRATMLRRSGEEAVETTLRR